MKDDAAKILIYIMGVAFAAGLLVLGGFRAATGEWYTPESCLESNKAAGFYPAIPPRKDAKEPF